MLSNLTLELTKADNLETVGFLLQELCSQLWNWDSFVFTVKRGRGSQRLRPVLLIDTINGEKVDCTSDCEPHTSYNKLWDTLTRGNPVLINRKVDPSAPESTYRFGADRPSLSLIYAPVRVVDRVAGVISIQSYTSEKFNDSDCELFCRLRMQLARLFSDAVQRSAFMSSFVSVNG